LTHLKQGQRDEALVYQHRASRGVTHPYQRMVLDQLEREILYGSATKDKTSLSLEEVLPTLNSLGKRSTDMGPGSSRNPVERTDTEIQTVCSALKSREHISESPSGVFNLAQCAEYEGRLEDSARLYDQYLAMAPEALDRDSVALRLVEIGVFKDSDPSSPERRQYQTGVKGLMTGAFNVANSAFQGLALSGPAGKVGWLQVGMISMLAGRREKARQYFGNLLTQETNTNMRDYIGQLLRNEEHDNTEFSKAMDEVLKFTEAYDFLEAAAAIEKPLSIYPLSPAANSLAAYIALNTNNYPAARRSMDILWYQSRPVFFYGAVESPNEKGTLLYRVQIFPDKVTLARAQVGAKTTDLLQGMEEGEPSSAAPAKSAQIIEFPKGEICRVRNTGGGLVVETPKGEWKVFPQVAFLPPKEGWPARAFMNDYADIFSSYLGLSNVELGEESTNAADRWRLTGKIALAALAGYAQGGGGYLNVMRGTGKTVVAVTASASAALAAMNEYHLYQATMNNTLNRFLFRPLVPSGGSLNFMVSPNSASSTSFSAAKPGLVNQLVIEYKKTKTKKEKASAGFATLQLEKDEVRLQNISQAAPAMTVACSVIARSLFATEIHIEARDGKLKTSDSASPWTISSSYLLTIQRTTKTQSEIQLLFSSNLHRSRLRTLLESHCDVGIPSSIEVARPAGEQWHAMFHGKLHETLPYKAEPFPSCDKIVSLKITMGVPRESVTQVGLEVETVDKRKILLSKGDLKTSIRIGSKLAQTCGIPLTW